ncbi:hypothetical protein NDU88_003002 [Pleurodeles waltl]|uniref:Uncharacterized protein n=1 Tax=Pleurodeles waltl TaxID=8319 RepID=A0AAV7TND7_PLEWA|nr:hypothetical protein NDU88_003002 [Pleurodeles waltl]
MIYNLAQAAEVLKAQTKRVGAQHKVTMHNYDYTMKWMVELMSMFKPQANTIANTHKCVHDEKMERSVEYYKAMQNWGRERKAAWGRSQIHSRWLATDPFSGVPGLLNRWAALVLLEALDEKVTPLLVEHVVEGVKLRGVKLELKAAGQVGWLFLSALRMVYRKTKLRDEVAALQERQLLMKETIESAVTRGDQMEARCTTLAVREAKQKSRQKPKMPSTVQVRALVRKQKSRQNPKMPSALQVRALVHKQKSRQKPKMPSTVQVRALVRKQKSRQKPKMPSAVQVRALVRKQKSRQKPKIPSTVQVMALVRKENWDPYTWDGTVSDNDEWNWEDEVEVRVTELGGVQVEKEV